MNAIKRNALHWSMILVVLLLSQAPVVKAAPGGIVRHVKPGATGSGPCDTWENACDLQTALGLAQVGDEIWVAEGVYTPNQVAAPYSSCQDIREHNSSASDGDYLIQPGDKPFLVYCADMAATPKEYLNLVSTPGRNYSQYTASDNTPGSDVLTYYSRVRLAPDTLVVDTSDQTFTSSTGSLTHLDGPEVTSMPYGVAMDCAGYNSTTGKGNIDLLITPFAIHSQETFIDGGNTSGGSATYYANRQFVNLQGGGVCGWINPAPGVFNPFNDRGGPILELEMIQPERRLTFQLKNGVALYGGFAGTEKERGERNWVEHFTVLSGDIEGDDLTDAHGIVTHPSNLTGYNSYHVVTGSGVYATAILDGFTVTAGNAYTYPMSSGGGMYNDNGSPTLRNITFSGNSAGNSGGGMFNTNSSSPTLANVTFSNNSAGLSDGGGGGMCNYNSSNPILTDVTFSTNYSFDIGGGLVNYNSSPSLTNVTFSGNTAVYRGGGMYNFSASDAVLTNVSFVNNSAIDPSSYTNGGGMYIDESSPNLTNVLVYANSAILGAGIYVTRSSPRLTNVTISGNITDGGGDCGISVSGGSHLILTNAIIWDNQCSTELYVDADSTADVTFSDIMVYRDLYPGNGNINGDPLFVDPNSGNLRLQRGSPAMDAGSNAAVPADEVDLDKDGDKSEPIPYDLDGNPRFVDFSKAGTSRVDMGAYEVQFIKLYLPSVTR
ncbi:MAG: right-handed parallel beta-helix repeat-containing protein [Chloroflexi bacterium]|nr:right-handed parallel beta-helix repeat-containing protein [Chloroflexota bacterium]